MLVFFSSQALHILKKDVRGLRLEIAILAAALALAVALDGSWIFPAWMPVGAVTTFLVFRLIHLEPAGRTSGANPFWMTRPYRPGALLAAKLTFVALFVSLPVAAAQLVLFTSRDGFSIGPNVDGIVWSTVLVHATVLVPLAALAALVRNLVHFVLALSGAALVMAFARSSSAGIPGEVLWIPNAIGLGILAATAPVVLCVQYSGRRNLHAIALAVLGFTAALGAVTLAAPAPVLAVQAIVGPRAFDPAAVEVVPVLDEITAERSFHPSWNGSEVLLRIPFRVSGAPERIDVRKDWSVGSATVDGDRRDLLQRSPRGWLLTVRIPASAFEGTGAGMSVRSTFWMTALEEAETTFIGPDEAAAMRNGIECRREPALAPDGVLPSEELTCRRPFAWGRHDLRVRGTGGTFARSLSTYSPFPSGLDLNERGTFQHRMPAADVDIEIVAHRPVAHFRKDVEFTLDLGAIDVAGEEITP